MNSAESNAAGDVPRYGADDLIRFCEALYRARGMRDDIAATSARILVEADLLGHSTHGLALLPGYLKALGDGTMLAAGEPLIENQRTVAQMWHGQRLSGLWLTHRAIGTATAKAAAREKSERFIEAEYTASIPRHARRRNPFPSTPQVATINK